MKIKTQTTINDKELSIGVGGQELTRYAIPFAAQLGQGMLTQIIQQLKSDQFDPSGIFCRHIPYNYVRYNAAFV